MGRWFLMALACGVAGVSPATAQEREWSLGASGEDVFLAFGVPETADIGVSFWCKIGSKNVSVFAPLPPMQGLSKNISKVTLDAGEQTFELRSKISDGSVEAALKPQGTVITALKAADHFGLSIGKHKTTYPMEGADFDGLLAMCANKDAGVMQ
jgi:hypothetical protein